MDLFDVNISSGSHVPLADRMRPRTLDEVVGQDHLLGEGKILRTMIEQDRLSSIIFWGPPGVGKTTIAHVIAGVTGTHFVALSAVSAGVKDLRDTVKQAEDLLKFKQQKTILFIDEIHRFNKAQQDALLPHVERGTVILIGATTENPSFEVNSALLSRSRVFVLRAHTVESLGGLMERALTDAVRGLGVANIQLTPAAREYVIEFSNGDGRAMLNALDIGVQFGVGSGAATKSKKKKGALLLDRAVFEEALQHKALQYDKGGEEHYNIISAFIKSMRNSDADAALYWLARMIEAGEDPLFIARRMVIFASEDVGNAAPTALVLTQAVFQSVHTIGMPESRIILAQGVVYLAEAKKSNRSYKGIEAALEDARKYGNLPVPLHLRNAVTKLMKGFGYGKDYQYAHDSKDAKTDMTCLPDELVGRSYLD